MKQYRSYVAIAILLLALSACQAIGGGAGNQATATVVSPTNNADSEVNPGFPMTGDAYNTTQAGGSLIFFTKMSLDDILKFYRDEYASKGYTERKELTVVTDATLNLVFDGDPSGKAVVIQSVDLGDGSRTVTIHLEDT